MTVGLVALSPAEVRAALALAAGQSVAIRAREGDVGALRAAGFVEAPGAIECFVRAPFPREKLTHRHRNTARSVKEWQERGLDLELTTLGSFGFDAFLGRVYFPIFARAMYTRGITPHAAHEVAGMRALVTDGSALALVRRGAEIVGAAVLRPGRALGPDDIAYGPRPGGAWHEGLLYGLHDALRSCQRALIVKLADACGARGHPWLSLGQDVAWCERGYDAVLREKLRVADAVVCRFEPLRHLFAWRPHPDEQLVFFEWLPGERAVALRNHGYDEAGFAEVVAAFGSRAVRPRSPGVKDDA